MTPLHLQALLASSSNEPEHEPQTPVFKAHEVQAVVLLAQVAQAEVAVSKNSPEGQSVQTPFEIVPKQDSQTFPE